MFEDILTCKISFPDGTSGRAGITRDGGFDVNSPPTVLGIRAYRLIVQGEYAFLPGDRVSVAGKDYFVSTEELSRIELDPGGFINDGPPVRRYVVTTEE